MPDVEYREITVRLWGKGVIERRRRLGAEISGDRRFAARSAQFIVSRIDARNGAMGLVPPELDGAIVSNDFPLFDLDKTKIQPEFLGWLCQTREFVELCQRASEGTTNRVRLQEGRFLALEIPLPPLAEQRRIVAKIDQLAAKIAEARGLCDQTIAETEFLTRSVFNSAFQSRTDWKCAEVGDLCEPPQYGFTESAITDPIGPRFLRITDIQGGSVNWDSVPYCDCPDPTKYLLQPDDILFARTGATTGKSFLVAECPTAVFASYLIRLRVRKQVTPEYLYIFFQSPQYWNQIADQKKGTGQPNLNGSKLSHLRIPVPPLHEQSHIVSRLKILQAKVNVLRGLQAQTTAELDALLPSILDKAFKGEL
jgi:type I restriction enzyme S subunit